jgi:hypothetical protein
MPGPAPEEFTTLTRSPGNAIEVPWCTRCFGRVDGEDGGIVVIETKVNEDGSAARRGVGLIGPELLDELFGCPEARARFDSDTVDKVVADAKECRVLRLGVEAFAAIMGGAARVTHEEIDAGRRQ